MKVLQRIVLELKVGGDGRFQLGKNELITERRGDK